MSCIVLCKEMVAVFPESAAPDNTTQRWLAVAGASLTFKDAGSRVVLFVNC